MSEGTSGSVRGVAVSCSGIKVSYGDFTALEDVSLGVGAGEFVALLGPSGSGKSTLLMTIAGFNRVDRGSVSFDGVDVTQVAPQRRGIGVVFQDYALFPHLSVIGNVGYAMRIAGASRRDTVRQAMEALELVRMADFADRRIQSLSGGQRQRVALARAIARRPRLLLLDEPFSALDRTLRDAMQLELRALHRQLGTTVISVTHDQREAFTLSDRIAVMEAGRLVQVGAPEQLYLRPASPFVARFLGEAAFLNVTRRGAEHLCQGRPLEGTFPAPGDAEGALCLVVRPEQIRPRLADQAVGPHTNLIEGVVRDIVFQGDSMLVLVSSAEGDFMCRHHDRHHARESMVVGERCGFLLPASDTLVLRGQAGAA